MSEVIEDQEEFEESERIEESLSYDPTEKTLNITDQVACKENITDVEFFGDNLFLLLSKASSEIEGWMKSTKAMQVAHGCVIQVTTQQRNQDGSYSIAEALTFAPNCRIIGDAKVGRYLK